MSTLEIIGALVVGSILLAIALIGLEIVANIVCCMRGAVRLARVYGRPVKAIWVIRFGLRHWAGARFNGDVGTYFQAGGMKVSPDIRDRIYRERFYGA